MQSTWVKPDFREVAVNGECTAYAGTGLDGPYPDDAPAASAPERPPGDGPAVLPPAAGAPA